MVEVVRHECCIIYIEWWKYRTLVVKIYLLREWASFILVFSCLVIFEVQKKNFLQGKTLLYNLDPDTKTVKVGCLALFLIAVVSLARFHDTSGRCVWQQTLFARWVVFFSYDILSITVITHRHIVDLSPLQTHSHKTLGSWSERAETLLKVFIWWCQCF